jgi:uncharacterized membrane protein YhiD involved in acid resistance
MNDTPAALLGWAIGIGASFIAAMVALFGLIWNIWRKRAEDNNALVEQVRALQLEVARNYITRAEFRQEMQGVADRLEAGIAKVDGRIQIFDTKLDDLGRYVRERPR